MSWSLIESDPAVFTELITQFGVKDVQVEEIYSLDDIHLDPVYGLIFLFKFTKQQASGTKYDDHELFFAHQVITNACATQAILSIILNSPLELGELKEFKEFTKDFPADMKGLAISNSETLRRVHNSFARQEMFIMDSKPATEDDDVFHFVAYIPYKGQILELDGLQSHPITHGDIPKSGWLAGVKPVIEQRIQKYSEKEIRFNLLAVTKDQRVVLKEKIKHADEAFKHELEAQLKQVEQQFERMHKENIRRKFNFIPLIFKLLELGQK